MRGMGTWGPAPFSDDTTAELREDYRTLLADGVADDEAAQRVIDVYTTHLGDDQQHLVWLGMAAAQSQVGRLQSDVRDRALQIIDQGIGLLLWREAGAKALSDRRVALDKLRLQLTGPQPAPKRVLKPWRYVTDLLAGQ